MVAVSWGWEMIRVGSRVEGVGIGLGGLDAVGSNRQLEDGREGLGGQTFKVKNVPSHVIVFKNSFDQSHNKRLVRL